MGLRICSLLVCVIPVIVGTLHAAEIPVSKGTKYVTSPLRADGSVDFLAAVDNAYCRGATAENNAAIPLWEALGPTAVPEEVRARYFAAIGMDVPSDQGDYFLPLADRKDVDARLNARSQIKFAGGEPWDEQSFPELAEWLEQNESALNRLVEASHRTRFYSPLISIEEDSPQLLASRLTGLLEVVEVVRALLARSLYRVHERDFRSAWADLNASYRWSRLIDDQPSLVCRNWSLALESETCYAIS